jgi:serine/threonine-protein kinase
MDLPSSNSRSTSGTSYNAAGGQLGAYRLDRRLAVGGMAEIFLATDTTQNRTVVIKLLLPQFQRDPDFVQMLRDEAQLTAKLNHPNLVRTIALEEVENHAFLVMEYVDGCTLGELLRQQESRGDAKLALALGRALLAALSYVHTFRDQDQHELNIVHRDLNPRNVMVSKMGQIKLGDFGIARSGVREARTRTGVIKGTVQYMAPEQISGDMLGPQTDLYGLGLILFEVLTGQPYIDGDREVALLHLAQNPVWRPPSTVQPALSPAFDVFLRPALMPFIEQRYQSAGAMTTRLERLCGKLDLHPLSDYEIGRRVRQALETVPDAAATATEITNANVRPHVPGANADVRPPELSAHAGPAATLPQPQSPRRAFPWLPLAALGILGVGIGLWTVLGGKEHLATPGIVDSALRAADATTVAHLPPVTEHGPQDNSAPWSTAGDSGPDRDAAGPALLPVDPKHKARSIDRAALEKRRKMNQWASRRRSKPPVEAAPAGDKPTGADSGTKANPAENERVHELRRRRGRVRVTLRQRGLLQSDLPAQLQSNWRQLDQALKRGDWDLATRQAETLEQGIAAVTIDRALVQRKLQLADTGLRRLPANDARARRLRQDAATALQAFMDGHYERANRTLNALLGQLQRHVAR